MAEELGYGTSMQVHFVGAATSRGTEQAAAAAARSGSSSRPSQTGQRFSIVGLTGFGPARLWR